MVAGGRVHAVLTDWPANDREAKIHGTQFRAAIEAASVSDDSVEAAQYAGQDD